MFDIYAKNVVKMRHLGFLTKNKHKEVARKVEKTISTRWPGLHVAVDGVYNKALLETINVLVEDRGSRDSMAKQFVKKLKISKFLGMLYSLKVMSPH